MVKLSVNVNKIAVLRNSRGKDQPNLIEAVKKLINFGADGITVHPRPDGRHILRGDVRNIGLYLKTEKEVEFNVEGRPDPSFLQLMEEIRPCQCTLVPDAPSALTSNAGWRLQENFSFLTPVLKLLKKNKIRSSLFIDPFTLTEKELSALSRLKPDRVELYTGSYADSYSTSQREAVTQIYISASEKIRALGTELNAGHDLNLNNLSRFLQKVPQIKEVSIGHALICEALYQGLETTVQKYLAICRSTGNKAT